ncbi:thiolase [Atractiella rhizophila]|nr:thiolase [Atractiella rhizophila]
MQHLLRPSTSTHISHFLRRSFASTPLRMSDVVILSAARTPVGSFNGSLKKLTAPQLGAIVVKGAIEKAGVKAEDVEEVYLGNVLQANIGQSPARQAAIGAGLPQSTEATTINKVCASGMKSIMLAAQSLKNGDRSLMVAGGMESMSNVPFYFPRNASYGHQTANDGIIKDGLWDIYNDIHMGNCAEETAKKYSITREDQDNFAIESYSRSTKAWAAGVYKNEIVPVTIPDPRKGDVEVVEDEDYSKLKLDKIKTLKPVFQKNGGTVTAANASNLNDGASALVLATQAKADELSVKPLAKIIAYADGACAPIDFPIAPATASIPAALKKAGLKAEDINLWEINEAFSVVVPASCKILGISTDKINVNGGAVALGHAIGSSGSRIVVSLVHALKQGEYGCAAVCNGGGGSSAIIVQKL